MIVCYVCHNYTTYAGQAMCILINTHISARQTSIYYILIQISVSIAWQTIYYTLI